MLFRSDSVITRYLIERGGLDIVQGPVLGVCAESGCKFLEATAYPRKLRAGLRVAKLGNSSVRYELGIFDGATLCAEGFFVHVFVDAKTRRPVPIPQRLREALQAIQP